MRLSTQVPLKEEITSNFVPAQARELTIKNWKYILRRPVVEVTDENVVVLQFLDCLKDLEKSEEEEPEVCGRILTGYAREHALTKAVVDRSLVNYSLKIYKAIYETGWILEEMHSQISDLVYAETDRGYGHVYCTGIGRYSGILLNRLLAAAGGHRP